MWVHPHISREICYCEICYCDESYEVFRLTSDAMGSVAALAALLVDTLVFSAKAIAGAKQNQAEQDGGMENVPKCPIF